MSGDANENKKKKRVMSSEELSSFCDQIALMLSSGMTLRDGIEMLAEDEMKNNDKVHPYTNLYKVVDETGSLYIAMRENEQDWPSYMIEMVDIGEQTGRLEDIMISLSTYYQREGRIRSAAISAITYPLVLGVMLWSLSASCCGGCCRCSAGCWNPWVCPLPVGTRSCRWGPTPAGPF